MRCEAIMISQHASGERCDAPAKHVFNGRAVCWTHLMACKGPRAGRPTENNGGTFSAGPVEFINRKAAAN